MVKRKLIKNSKKIDNFLINYLKDQDKSLLINPMKYGLISGGVKKLDQQLYLMLEKFFLN